MLGIFVVLTDSVCMQGMQCRMFSWSLFKKFFYLKVIFLNIFVGYDVAM